VNAPSARHCGQAFAGPDASGQPLAQPRGRDEAGGVAVAGRHRLVVVDDEPDLRVMLAEYLGRHGYAVATVADGAELDNCLAESMPDLLILDVNMPGESGFDIARRIRAAGDVPILMLTAADEVVDRVVGLELGADDYVTKPFDLRELRARIQAVLRRGSRRAPRAQTEAPPTLVSFGDLRLDIDARRLIRENGEELALTAMEFDLLAAFARNPNRVLTRERLLDIAHSRDGEPFDRSIDVRIARIRRKIERDPARPQVIKTMRGAGYMFVPGKS
jgi:two-component system phosphate regulon response regulator OmpR